MSHFVDGKCDCPAVGQCSECGKDCTDHDLIGNQVELGFPILWCGECMNKSLDGYEAEKINSLCQVVHEANKKWWHDINTGERLNRNVGEMLCLVHSEISEALEGHRKNLQDTHIPTRPMIEVELADAIIRIFDIAAGLGLDLGGAFLEKMAYNRTRKDHSIEERKKENGKKF
jgi:NTP pyrophosphatase (non-canonical NTP hydrolase)